MADEPAGGGGVSKAGSGGIESRGGNIRKIGESVKKRKGESEGVSEVRINKRLIGLFIAYVE